MSTMQVFYATAPESGMLTLPEELRGKPLKIVVEKESTKSAVQDLLDYCASEAGILSVARTLKNSTNEDDCDEHLPNANLKKGILGLRGIMKNYTMAELEDARYEYLVEKYVHD